MSGCLIYSAHIVRYVRADNKIVKVLLPLKSTGIVQDIEKRLPANWKWFTVEVKN